MNPRTQSVQAILERQTRLKTPRKPSKTKNTTPLESEEQSLLFAWAKANEYRVPALTMLFASANGGSRVLTDVSGGKKIPLEAMALRRQGVKPGTPDIFLDFPSNGKHGLRIELKRQKGGVVSKEQKAWLEKYNANGYTAIVCYGFDQARDAICAYLGITDLAHTAVQATDWSNL
jgi:VRR-NUC domain